MWTATAESGLWLAAAAVTSGLLAYCQGAACPTTGAKCRPLLGLLCLAPAFAFALAAYTLQQQDDPRRLWPALGMQAAQALGYLTVGICLFLYAMDTSGDLTRLLHGRLRGKHVLILVGVGGCAGALALQLLSLYALFKGYRWLQAARAQLSEDSADFVEHSDQRRRWLT